MRDPLERALGETTRTHLTRKWIHQPPFEVRTVVDPPHVLPKRIACPVYQGDPEEMVICVGPGKRPTKRSQVTESRVHDEETLLGALISVFGKQAFSAFRTVRHAEDIISESAIIALSKLRRAEEEHGVKALIPEGLVYYVVRGVLRHRSMGDGRYTSTESSQAREVLRREIDRLASQGVETQGQAFVKLARQILESYPVRRRPTYGYEWNWLEIPKPHCDDEWSGESGIGAFMDPVISAEDEVLGMAGISEIQQWQDRQETPSARRPTNTYVRGVQIAGLPFPAQGKPGDRTCSRARDVFARAADSGATALRRVIDELGSGSDVDAAFDLSDGADERMREMASICDDNDLLELAAGALMVMGHVSRYRKYLESKAA